MTARIGFVSHFLGGGTDLDRPGYPAGGTGGLNLWRHALRAILFWWARFVSPPFFWCCFVPNYATHYTTEQVKSQRSKRKTIFRKEGC